MFTLPNLLSLTRLPLAVLFMQDNLLCRSIAIVLAMVSDGLDGYLARRYKMSSVLGSILDPIMDKLFVFFVVSVLLNEHKINQWEALTLFCRDIAVLLFGLYLLLTQNIFKYEVKAIWCGKITTTLQFFLFLAIIMKYPIPLGCYAIFIVMGCLSLVELFLTYRFKRNSLNI